MDGLLDMTTAQAQQAPWWRSDSSKLMLCFLYEEHTGDAYSRIGS